MGKDPRKERANQDPVVVAVVVAVAVESMLETQENLLERVRKFHYPLTSVGDVEKEGTRKVNLVKLWKQFAETVEQRVTMRKCVWRSQPTWWMFQGLPLILNQITSMNMETLCMPIHTWVHVKETNWNKHLIQFPISTDFKKVRNSQERCPSILLKADTGADVNLMNSTTFARVIEDRSALQLTSLWMEAYGNNTAVEVLGKFHAFLRWKGRIYKQLFYVTNANASPNLLSRDSCYTLGVLKPCYSVETSGNSSKFQGKPQATPTQPTTNLEKPKMHGISSHHLSDEGTSEEKLSSFHSVVSLQGATSRPAIEETGHP